MYYYRDQEPRHDHALYLVHAGEGDLQGDVLIAALGSVQLAGLCPHLNTEL